MTSIEWLEGQLINLMSFDTVEFRKEFREKIEQAKQMHKTEQDNISAQRYMDGYNKAKETLHTKDQMKESWWKGWEAYGESL